MNSPRPGKYKLLVFDFDGTLAETFEDIASCMEKTFENLGEHPPAPSAVRAVMNVPLESAIQQLLRKELPPAQIAEWVGVYRSIYNGERDWKTVLFPGARALLAQVAAQGIPALVVSNKGSVAVSLEMQRLEISGYFQMIFAADAAYRKPDPRLYHDEIKSRITVADDREVLVIGDSVSDIEFARNAGLDCCWAAYGYGNREECMNLKPDFMIESLDELRLLAFA